MSEGKKSVRKVPRLAAGDTIAFMAPSNRVDREILGQSKAMLEARGYHVLIHPQCFKKLHQSAGTGLEKADALHDLVRNVEVKAVFFARGGNRAMTMLEHLNFKLIKDYPKIYMGYSDTTVLLNAIYKNTGITTYHGPMSHGLVSLPKKQIGQCFGLLSGDAKPLSMPKAKILKPGTGTGRLIGGNLSLLCALLGTDFQPDFDNAILFLEDVSEESSRIDRNFWHLRNSGALAKLNGLVMGGFTRTTDTGKTKFGFSLKESISSATDGYDYPIVMNAPFGHGQELYTFPIGDMARLEARPTNAASCPILTL